MTQNLPAVVYHPLSELTEQNELDLVLNAASEVLNAGHITAIVNAFFVNTKICVNGIPYLKVSGLSTILRTGNSGAERPLIYQGIPGIISASEIVEIDGVEHISGPTLRGLIDTRISLTAGRTRQYLMIAMQSYERILNLSQVRDLKDLFLEDIRNNRPLLKTQRIAEYNITSCEFTGIPFNNRAEVEFAHIESVVTNPMLALDINNGVIIQREIHQELTRRGIHGYEGMYKYCQEHSYSTRWAD
ncbi:hypothetical protein SAMN05216271_2230 [Halopseudomonas sabulinigri]|uniref:Uncharacterized protein n=1 Tax=Halopseudomonas sabulinigri TaxID=472181 RepID=A0A1H1TCJ3_9GAMM|nr:hypothetical protein [Halopseudomonas sabulinigri]SDS57844.1 hypothetical protein SAMN05216271_2230 [Halopseudomonas sabulinigri]